MTSVSCFVYAAMTICPLLITGGLNVDGEADSWDFGVGM